MKFAPYWLDTSRQGPDRSTTEVSGDVEVPVVGAGLTGLPSARHLTGKPHRRVLAPVLTDQDVADVNLARGALESAAIRAIIARGLMDTAYEALDKHPGRSREDTVAGHRKIAHAVREGDADQALSTAARELR